VQLYFYSPPVWIIVTLTFNFIIDLSLLKWQYICGAPMGKTVSFRITVLIGKRAKREDLRKAVTASKDG
jgi:hypothetical protein